MIFYSLCCINVTTCFILPPITTMLSSTIFACSPSPPKSCLKNQSFIGPRCGKNASFREDYSDLSTKVMVEGPSGDAGASKWGRSIVSGKTPDEIAEAFDGKLTLANTKFRGNHDYRVGEICVIPKDTTPTCPDAKTYTERVGNIEQGWCWVQGSTLSRGLAEADFLRDGKKITACNAMFAQIIAEELPDVVIISCEDVDDSTTSCVITAHPDYVRGCFGDEERSVVREKLAFWLRWNEWKKFEAIVVANTDLVNHPTEFDSAYGIYWRAANRKERRFDEVYEIDEDTESELHKAQKNNGKLMMIFKDGHLSDS